MPNIFNLKQKRRERIKNQPFPNEWQNFLKNNVSYYNHLSEEDKTELKGHVLVFLNEKKFEALEGLELTEEIKLTIAAQACVLLLHRDTDYYPTLHTILVYPHAFYSHIKKRLPGGLIAEGEQGRLGESWYRGPVVLSWDDVKRAAHDYNDAHNVVFHEFAHQLDSESGANEGTPDLPNRSMYIAWARIMSDEYKHLIDEIKHHHNTDIDTYGATNPAEFFAVITEAFFENPIQLKSHHPKLYELLALFYKQDPIKRFLNQN